MKCFVIFLFCTIVSLCDLAANAQSIDSFNFKTIFYQESEKDFVNPERGFFRTAFTTSSNFVPLNKSTLEKYREGEEVPGTNYKVFSSLLQRVYVLDNFKNKPLSTSFLHDINNDCQIAREAGIKLILRFNYTVTPHSGDCPGRSICPPYGDAPVSIVLQQISQLAPYFKKNADVIACVQEGFIGIWGENFYSDYFGDASENGHGRLLDSDWVKHNAVLNALLHAVSQDRMIQVRTPQYKQRYVYGIESPITSLPLTEKKAFNGSAEARIGFHDDAFLSDPSDMGTFYDYGDSSTPSSSSKKTISILKNYMDEDSKFVVVGGETDDPSDTSICFCVNSGGRVEKELRKFHYSFLNSEYQRKVIGDWALQGCLDSIKRDLGYRFVLESAIFPRIVEKEKSLTIVLNLKNVGYTSPFNSRPVELVFKNIKSGKTTLVDLSTDIRRWFPGQIEVKEILKLPTSISKGTYELYLNIPDSYRSLSKDPRFSIRLADDGVWEPKTGYNKLGDIIKVK